MQYIENSEECDIDEELKTWDKKRKCMCCGKKIPHDELLVITEVFGEEIELCTQCWKESKQEWEKTWNQLCKKNKALQLKIKSKTKKK